MTNNGSNQMFTMNSNDSLDDHRELVRRQTEFWEGLAFMVLGLSGLCECASLFLGR